MFRISQLANGSVVINVEEIRIGAAKQEADEVGQIKAQLRGIQEHVEKVKQALGSDYFAVGRLRKQIDETSGAVLKPRVQDIESQLTTIRDEVEQWCNKIKEVSDQIKTLEDDIKDASRKKHGAAGSNNLLGSANGAVSDSGVALAEGGGHLPRDIADFSRTSSSRYQEDSNSWSARGAAGAAEASTRVVLQEAELDGLGERLVPPHMRPVNRQSAADVGSNYVPYGPASGIPAQAVDVLSNQYAGMSLVDSPSAGRSLPAVHRVSHMSGRDAPANPVHSGNHRHTPGRPTGPSVAGVFVEESTPVRSRWPSWSRNLGWGSSSRSSSVRRR